MSRRLLASVLLVASLGLGACSDSDDTNDPGPGAVGAKGVVRDAGVHRAVCARVQEWWATLPGWTVLGVTSSPITGPEGNREFLIAANRIKV